MDENQLNLSPEDLEALSKLGISEEQLGQLHEQYNTARDQRFQAGPEMRQAGRVQVAANPLEHIGNAIQKYRGGQAMQDIQGQMKDLNAQNAGTRQQMMGRYMQMQQAGGGMAPPPVVDQGTGAVMSPIPGPQQRQQMMSQMLRRGG